jgi:hypothetical protein
MLKGFYASAARMVHSPGTPLSVWWPRSANSMPDPATRSRTVEVASTSPGCARAQTRAPMCTAIPVRSSPRFSHSPTCTPATHVDPERTRAVGDRLCAAHGTCGPVERGEEAVAGGVDLLAAEPFELRAYHRVVAVEVCAPLLIAEFGETFG